MGLNYDKCKVMQFSCASREVQMPAVYLSGLEMVRVAETRYLGVTLQSNPCIWTSHCRRTLKRCRSVFIASETFIVNAPQIV